jgi:hypothetical protein
MTNKDYFRNYYQVNREKLLTQQKQYYYKNRGYINAKCPSCAKRRCRDLRECQSERKESKQKPLSAEFARTYGHIEVRFD